MHIPENYLSPQTCAVTAAAMIPVWAVSIYKVRKEVPAEKISYIGVAAAFSFLGMMFNIPLPGGTTGHAVGGTFISILLGPYASCIAVSVALLIQAVLFGDGGILSYGANCFNMAFVLPFVGYGTYRLLKKVIKGKNSDYIAAGIGSYAGINAAALCAAVEFGIQPLLFHDAAGNALYCPYGLNVSIPAMMIGHLTIFGAAEVIFTIALYAFVRNVSPEMIKDTKEIKTSKGLIALLTVIVLAVPSGLLAEGTAWGEWGADEIASTGAGYVPAGMKNGFEWHALLPDYSMNGVPDWFGYILSAVIGTALLVIICRLISMNHTDKKAA